MKGTVGELGEFGLIRELTSRLTTTSAVRVGPGDDAAVVAAPDRRVVASTDILLEGRHFRRDWSTAYDVGRKAAAQNLADIAAMGAVPTALLLGLVVPAELPVTWPSEMMDGLRDECQVAGASVVGGDVVRGDTIMVSITALGDLRNQEPVTRGGAQPGDLVAVTGWLGWSAAGYAVLSRGFRSPRAFVEAHRRPEPPYHAGPAAAALGATAMCDVSDGLIADLGHIAEASKVRIDIRSGAIDIPTQMNDIGQAVGVDPIQWVLTGGEDHAIVATFPPDVKLPARWKVIGEVLNPSALPQVTVDGAPWTRQGGWDHFGDIEGRSAVKPRVLTVAGSDSGGGAGIQADLKTMLALGTHGMSVVTAVTAQNSLGVQGAWELPVAAVRAQYRSVVDDIGVQAVKTGMLASAELVEAVAELIAGTDAPAVVDPVGVSKHGDSLLASSALDSVRTELLPVATVATPNLDEVAQLTGVHVTSEEDLRRAAAAVLAYGPRWALIKGGHLSGDAVDLLTDGTEEHWLRAPRYDNRHTHGTGCTLASAIAAHLARGRSVPEAVTAAKAYVTGAIAAGFALGGGIGPVDHGWELRRGTTGV